MLVCYCRTQGWDIYVGPRSGSMPGVNEEKVSTNEMNALSLYMRLICVTLSRTY